MTWIPLYSCDGLNPAQGKAAATKRSFRYWSGLGVGLFVLMLAIFYWGLHYRIQQYEAAQKNNGASHRVKMWWEERSNASPSASVHGQLDSATSKNHQVFTGFGNFLLLVCPLILALHVSSAGLSSLKRSRTNSLSWLYLPSLCSRPPPTFLR